MLNIKTFMAGDHRRCDEILAIAEQAVLNQTWERALIAFTQFQQAVLQHFAAEETLLFTAFEEKTGLRGGPTEVMRGEHTQMRELMEAARQALLAQDADDYSGNTETLLIMMQQHNIKEENVLYPLCDQHLRDQVDLLLPRLQSTINVSTE